MRTQLKHAIHYSKRLKSGDHAPYSLYGAWFSLFRRFELHVLTEYAYMIQSAEILDSKRVTCAPRLNIHVLMYI